MNWYKRYIIVLIFVVLSFLYLLFGNTIFPEFFTSFEEVDNIQCYRVKNEATLPDISEISPSKGDSIFFHETSCHSYKKGKIVLTARQACAVESAAKMNPNREVYLLFTSPGIVKDEGTEEDKIIEALNTSYTNIHFHYLNFEKYVNNTPLRRIYESGKLENSKFPMSHASDVLRYLTLWKYGGTYLDLDIIVIKSLEDLPPNYTGLESSTNAAAGIINFSSDETGQRFANMCVNDLRKNFNGELWGNNGPGVISRMVKKLCHVRYVSNLSKYECEGFKIYKPEVFYPIGWMDWRYYFHSRDLSRVIEATEKSYILHVWNKHSENTKLNKNSKAAYVIFAKKYCPHVFQVLNKYF